jgi:hypothetical protein
MVEDYTFPVDGVGTTRSATVCYGHYIEAGFVLCIIYICIKLWRMRWAGHVARMGEKRNAYRILVGDPEGKRPLGRPRRRWVDNIKIDLREIGWDGGDWIDLAQNRDHWRALVKAVMNLRVPENAGKFLCGCTIVRFSRSAQLHE